MLAINVLLLRYFINLCHYYLFIWQEVSDVATSQVRALEMQQISRDKEVISLQQQLLDFQAQSDEKTVIGIQCCIDIYTNPGTSVNEELYREARARTYVCTEISESLR